MERGGTFIFKPPHQFYSELPQNEDLTMRMAAIIMDVPLHGMIYNIDNTLTYFIKRFDRKPGGHKVAVEDFSQLLGYSRETKYESSMEKVAISQWENFGEREFSFYRKTKWLSSSTSREGKKTVRLIS